MDLISKCTKREQRVEWTEQGVNFRGFVDMVGDGWIADIKTCADAFNALHLIQRQRRRRHLELQQIAKRHHRTVLQQRFVGGEMVVAGALC